MPTLGLVLLTIAWFVGDYYNAIDLELVRHPHFGYVLIGLAILSVFDK